MRLFVLATANHDKAAEIRTILGRDFSLLERPLDVPEVIEDGDTLEANALLKARALVAATGHAAIADDTGLFVDALNGAPGVFSARYAGENASYSDNVVKLLLALTNVNDAERTARFATVAAVVYPDGDSVVVTGVLTGLIAREPRGSNGFGYDPIFVPDDSSGESLAEMSTEQKNEISHRARAFRLLAERLVTI